MVGFVLAFALAAAAGCGGGDDGVSSRAAVEAAPSVLVSAKQRGFRLLPSPTTKSVFGVGVGNCKAERLYASSNTNTNTNNQH